VIAAHRTGFADHGMYVAPAAEQGRLERLEYSATRVRVDLELPDLDAVSAHTTR
jgi:hypothetical protein